MELFSKKIGTIFMKENSDADTFFKKMELLREKTEGDLKQEIEKYGGEMLNILNQFSSRE